MRGIQYAAAWRFFHWRSGILGPRFRGGDEVLVFTRRVPRPHQQRIDRPRAAAAFADRRTATRRRTGRS